MLHNPYMVDLGSGHMLLTPERRRDVGTLRRAPGHRRLSMRKGERRRRRDWKSIDADGLAKESGEITAVDGLTFHVGEGEVFGFLGPNGAGRTAAVRMLGGQALAAGAPPESSGTGSRTTRWPSE